MADSGRRKKQAMAVALDRVGTDGTERFHWLQAFAARELGSAVTEETLLEVQAFVESMRPPPVPRPWEGVAGSSVSYSDDVIDSDAVHTLQRDLAAGLEGLRAQSLYAPPAPLSGHVRGWILGQGRDVRFEVRTLNDRFALAVFDVLDEVRDRLQVCSAPRCWQLFFHRRRGQKYCSEKCGNAVHLAKFRLEHQERLSAGRHARYADRRQRELGRSKPLKVARRRRSPKGFKYETDS